MKDQVVGLKLEKQVTSLEPSKELKKLGVKQDSLWYWTWAEWNEKTEWVLIPWDRAIKLNKETYSAFTVAELGEMLPVEIKSYKFKGKFAPNIGNTMYCCIGQDALIKIEDTEVDARVKMVIYLIENKLVEVK